MDIRIEKGTRQYLNDCEEALLNSELGRKYFTGAGAGKKAVPEGIEQGNLQGYRKKGIGKILIDFFVNAICAEDKKIFLAVADFNPVAKRFYEKNGFRQVGELPNLYRDDITEFLMMKEK